MREGASFVGMSVTKKKIITLTLERATEGETAAEARRIADDKVLKGLLV